MDLGGAATNDANERRSKHTTPQHSTITTCYQHGYCLTHSNGFLFARRGERVRTSTIGSSTTDSMTTCEESSSCPICLESLFSTLAVSNISEDPGRSYHASFGTGTASHTTSTTATSPIGAAVPCGHCLHVHCWDEWMAASMRHRGGAGHHNHSTILSTKCPLCNCPTTAFARLFLNIPTAATHLTIHDNDDDDLDDISIETDEEEEAEDNDDDDPEEGRDDAPSDDTHHHHHHPGTSNIDNDVVNVDDHTHMDDDRKRPFQHQISTSESTSCTSTHASLPPPIIDLLGDGDDDDDDDYNTPIHHNHQPPTTTSIMIVTIDDRDEPEETSGKMKAPKSNSNNKTPKNPSTTAALRKYRRMIRKWQQQKKVLTSQCEQYVAQCRTVQATLSDRQDEYSALLQKYQSLEATRHQTQLRIDHITLEKVQLQNQVYSLQAQLREQTTLVQTKTTELQTRELQHYQQMKALQNKKHCNMSEVQTILQERPKLLEQVRALKEHVQHLQHQSRSSVLSNVMRSSTTTNKNSSNRHGRTTHSTNQSSPPPPLLKSVATHKRRKQLLRTISEGIDQSHQQQHPPAEVPDRRRVLITTQPRNTSSSTLLPLVRRQSLDDNDIPDDDIVGHAGGVMTVTPPLSARWSGGGRHPPGQARALQRRRWHSLGPGAATALRRRSSGRGHT